MPPRESTSRSPRTNVYSVLLVVSAAFLALALFITWGELKSDYDFMGTAGQYDVQEMDSGSEATDATDATDAPEESEDPEAE